jgi:hypothetical protein
MATRPRTTPHLAVSVVAVVAMLAACTPTQRQPRHDPRTADRCDVDSTLQAGKARQDRPVITTLQTRNHEVTVYGGQGGLRFTVSVGETVLAQMLEESDFANSFPGLHRHFESAFAGETWLDASVDRQPTNNVSSAWAGM